MIWLFWIYIYMVERSLPAQTAPLCVFSACSTCATEDRRAIREKWSQTEMPGGEHLHGVVCVMWVCVSVVYTHMILVSCVMESEGGLVSNCFVGSV